jgi:Cof subfamily protein (haloacid dehalogenase superfamily)
MYRLVFCDLDGTVATHDGQVRRAVREAMQAVVDAGAWITISTGRGYQTVRAFLGIVAVNAPLVCCNGGLIVEPSTREVLYLKPMSLSLAHDLVHLAQEEGITMWFYLPDMETMLDNHVDAPGFVLRRDGVVIRQVGDPIAELTQPPHKVVLPVEPPQLTQAVVARVQQCVGDRARVLASRPQWVEVIMPGISKAGALSWVASHLGVQQEETIAIGDGENDIEMLEWAGCGIAMGNATAAVKAAADWIAPSVEKDGVAKALRRFVLAS